MEKERYYSLIDNNGNFELRDYETSQEIHSLFELDDLLNQQDAKIKELEKENGYVLFEDGYDKDGNEIHKQVYTTYKQEFERLVLENKKLRKENQQLKNALKLACEKIIDQNGFIYNFVSDKVIETPEKLADLYKQQTKKKGKIK